MNVARKRTDYIVIHCSATPPTMDIGRKEIDKWHRANGWLMIGYHFVIGRDGRIETGRPLQDAGAHVNPPEGINSRSVGICLVGGVDKDNKPQNNFTPEQWASLEELVGELEQQYPQAKIVGHGELSRDRACPSFNVQLWVKERKRPDSIQLVEGAETRYLPILKLGSQGQPVRLMQGLLRTVAQTGIFGRTTEEKVREFQRQHGLTVDGIVGPKTWKALYERVKR